MKSSFAVYQQGKQSIKSTITEEGVKRMPKANSDVIDDQWKLVSTKFRLMR